MDRNAQNALLEQLEDHARRSADAIASLRAEVLELRGELSEMEAERAEISRSEAKRAEDVEALRAAVGRLEALSQVQSQLEALRGDQSQNASRLESLEGQLRQVDQVQSAMGQLRGEVVAQIEDRERALRDELKAMAKQRSSESEAAGRQHQATAVRLEELGLMEARLERLERQRGEILREIQSTADGLDVAAAARAEIKEDIRREQQQGVQRVDGLSAEIDAMQERMEAWRKQLRQHQEILRRAESVTAEAERAVEQVRAAHHATEEAQRVAEGRMDASLRTLREEADERGERLVGLRRNAWEEHDRKHVEEREVLDEEIAALAERLGVAERALEASMGAGMEVAQRDIDEMKRRLARFVQQMHEVTQANLDAIGTDLPSDDPSVVGPERRQALRRALRARRAAGG